MNHLVKLSAQRSKIAGLCIALLLSLGISAERAGALAADAQDNVRSFYGTLLTTMKDGRTLGQSGRYARLAPVVAVGFTAGGRRVRSSARRSRRSTPRTTTRRSR